MLGRSRGTCKIARRALDSRMNRLLQSGLGVTAGAAVGTGGILWLSSVRQSHGDVASAASPINASPAVERFEIDAKRSRFGFRAKRVLVNTVPGEFTGFSGAVDAEQLVEIFREQSEP